MRLQVTFRIAVILNKSLREDLDSLNFLGRFLNERAANVITNVARPSRTIRFDALSLVGFASARHLAFPITFDKARTEACSRARLIQS